MNFEDALKTIISISPWLVVKIIFLVLLLFYVFFAVMLNRQVTLMNNVLEAKFSPLIKLIANIHMIAVITLFFITLIFL